MYDLVLSVEYSVNPGVKSCVMVSAQQYRNPLSPGLAEIAESIHLFLIKTLTRFDTSVENSSQNPFIGFPSATEFMQVDATVAKWFRSMRLVVDYLKHVEPITNACLLRLSEE